MYSSARSPDPFEHQEIALIFNAKSSMFMRVRRTVPQFTFSFSASFVNLISSVSTGFFRFFSVLSGIRHIVLQKPAKNAIFRTSKAKTAALQKLSEHRLSRLRSQRSVQQRDHRSSHLEPLHNLL